MKTGLLSNLRIPGVRRNEIYSRTVPWHRSVLCVVHVAAAGVRLSFSPDRVEVSGAVGDGFRVVAVRMVVSSRAGIIAVRRGLSHRLLRAPVRGPISATPHVYVPDAA